RETISDQQRAGALQCVQSPITFINCPSRRPSEPIPFGWSGFSSGYQAQNAANAFSAGRTDYAGNGGDSGLDHGSGPGSLSAGLARGSEDNSAAFTGVTFDRSMIRLAQITDGTSNTYFAGEKYLNPEHYLTGGDAADNETWCTGWNNDNFRIAGDCDPNRGCTANQYIPPLPDTPGFQSSVRFGSAHPATFHVVHCDGSTRGISYDIDPETHRRLANREDSETIDASAF
ncbi:MAG: DUF1559 domain-containing protein, partial [Planctomycetota bacterium]